MERGRTPYIACLASFIILSVITGCSRNDTFPQQLIGSWKTSAPKYADRYLEFSEDFVTFGIGEGGEESYYIRKIRTEQDASGLLCTLHYEDSEKEEWILTFVYRPDNGGTIKLSNSENIWNKVDSGEE